jgi:hypothetical protein
MDWHDYLREERKRKLAANDLMSSGRLGTREKRDGEFVDTTAEMITTNNNHIAEIEGILTAANIAFDL